LSEGEGYENDTGIGIREKGGGGTPKRINEESRYQSGIRNQKEVREQVRRWSVRWNR
jgi:hypothetical protein